MRAMNELRIVFSVRFLCISSHRIEQSLTRHEGFSDIPGKVLDRPPTSLRAVLVYGPNEGLVRERARAYTQAYHRAADGSVSDIRGLTHSLARRYGGLFEHVEARSLTGKRRVLVITEADDRLTKNLVKVVSETKNDTLSHFARRGPDSRSSLRKICRAAGTLCSHCLLR